jgi:hypothetical protein
VRARQGRAKESTGATRPAALSELPHHDELVSDNTDETIAHLFVCPNCSGAMQSSLR